MTQITGTPTANTTERPLFIRDLPGLVGPIAEHIHQSRPEIIFAVDRGARLGALALFKLYKLAYKEPISSEGNRIEFLNFSKSNRECVDMRSQVVRVGDFLAERLMPVDEPFRSKRILFIDDWVDTGHTSDVLINAASSIGVGRSDVGLATLCGKQRQDVMHVVGNTDMHSTNSIWNAYEEMTGVSRDIETQKVAGNTSVWSLNARRELTEAVDRYFTATTQQ